MANVRQIAKQAGVSITTVSRVLNNHPRVSEVARKRVLEVANASSYVPTVSRRTSTNVAIAYPGEPCLSSFDAALMSGMGGGMEEFGFDLMILNMRRSHLPYETYTQMFQRRGIRAVLLRTNAQSRHICKAIADEGFPAIVIGDRFDDSPNVSFLDCESRTPSREAIAHLLALGHRRIAISLNVFDDADHADRLAGYQDALRDFGVEFDDRLIIRAPATREGGAQVMRRILTLPEAPTAVYVADPVAVVGATGEARKMGIRIPDDLSLVGFDDADMRFGLWSEMSAVCQDAAALGGQAFTVLNQMLAAQGSLPVIRRSLRAWFEIHGSTGAVPARSSGTTAPA